MAKVHVAQCAEATKRWRVEWNRPMAVLSFFIALNIVSMPLRAYLIETPPWSGRTQPVEWNGTTYTANSTWMVLQRMQALYNDDTMPGNDTIYRDSKNYTTVMRRVVQFGHGKSCEDTFHLLPGAMFYGSGMRQAICQYLETTATGATTTMAHCQHMRNFGVTITEQCVWMYPQGHSWHVVYQTLYQWEIVWFLWVKLVLRCLLSGYVVYKMQLHYYRHYAALARDLAQYGIPDPASPVHRIEVFVGDPTCFILGSPVISLCFVVDFWMSVTSVGEGILQLSQLDDMTLFIAGCLYASRTVWFAYFSMRYATIAIKWWRISSWVVPLDPTAIAVGAFILSGPYIYLNTTTPLVWLQYALWSIGVPEADLHDTTEIFPAIVALTALIGSVPIILVVCVKLSHLAVAALMPRPRRSATKPMKPTRRYSSMDFNDLNQRIVLSILRHSLTESDRSRGGTVYSLYDVCASYQQMPLFSHRSADCFVVGYDASNAPIEHLRLSLLGCADFARNGHAAISMCGTTHPSAVCELNSAPCATSSTVARLRLHSGANNSKWLL